MCAHLIFVAVVKKCYTLRPQAWQIPVGQNRKRGRPRKATRALIRDIEENLNEADAVSYTHLTLPTTPYV